MEIDFIKWLVSYADGFELSTMSTDQISIELIDIEEVVSFSTNIVIGNGDPESNEQWQKLYYPLLLQRAIEGINTSNDTGILLTLDDVRIVHYRDYINPIELWHFEKFSHDQAKAEALKYIYGRKNERY